MWWQQFSAGVFISTGVLLAVAGALKCANRSHHIANSKSVVGSDPRNQEETSVRLLGQLGPILLSFMDRRFRLLGLIEIAVAATSLVCFSRKWFLAAGVSLTSVGLAFVVLTLLRFKLQPEQGCGCLRRAGEDEGFATSSLVRAIAVFIGGLCGFLRPTLGHFSGFWIAGWLGLITIVSPELWRQTNWRCGRPLIFGRYDDELKVRHSREFRRLTRLSALDIGSKDYWRQGCESFVSYALTSTDIDEGMFVVFMLSAGGVSSRMVPLGSESAPQVPSSTEFATVELEG